MEAGGLEEEHAGFSVRCGGSEPREETSVSDEQKGECLIYAVSSL